MTTRKQQLRDAQRKLRNIRRRTDYVRMEVYLSGEAERKLVLKSKEHNLTRGEFLNMLLISYDDQSKYENELISVLASQGNSLVKEQAELLNEEMLKKQEKLDYWTLRYQKLCAALEQTGIKMHE